MIKQRLIVGIDPDVQKSGVATLEAYSRRLEVSALSFGQLLDYFLWLRGKLNDDETAVTIVVEAGWHNKGNWHVLASDNKGQACAKGYYVGRNHQTGMLICETAVSLGFDVVERTPLRKHWHGHDKKITSDEIERITGLHGRTTQDGRDAALLAWEYAGLPIKIKPSTNQKEKRTK